MLSTMILTALALGATPDIESPWDAPGTWAWHIGEVSPDPVQFDGADLTEQVVSAWVSNQGTTQSLVGWGSLTHTTGAGVENIDRYAWIHTYVDDTANGHDELYLLTDRQWTGADLKYDGWPVIAWLKPVDDTSGYPTLSGPSADLVEQVGVYVSDLEAMDACYTGTTLDGPRDAATATARDYYDNPLLPPLTDISLQFVYFKSATQRSAYISGHPWDDSDYLRVHGPNEEPTIAATQGMMASLYWLWLAGCDGNCFPKDRTICPGNRQARCKAGETTGNNFCGMCKQEIDCTYTCLYSHYPCKENDYFPPMEVVTTVP